MSEQVRRVSISDNNLISKACPVLGELPRCEQRGVLGSSPRVVVCVVMLKVLATKSVGVVHSI